MNTYETEELDNYEIPDASAVPTGGGGFPNWRPADGKLVRGSENDGTLQECPDKKVVGRLTRVGIHSDTDQKTGESWTKVECELETSTGKQGVGVKITSKLATCNLISGLLAAAKNQLICIEAVPGTQKNRYGKLGTFLNIYSVDPANPKSTKRINDKTITGITDLEKRLATALEMIQVHPAYAERPKRQDQDPWQALIDCIEGHGNACAWPHPLDALQAYCELCSAASEEVVGEARVYKQASEIDGAVIRELIAVINSEPTNKTAVPDILLEAVKPAETKASGAFKKQA